MAPYQIDLRTGAMRQVAEAAKLDTTSLCFDPSGRTAFFLDGTALQEAAFGGKHGPRQVADDLTAFALGQSRSELFGIRSGKLQQLHESRTTILAEDAVAPCAVRPGGQGCLFARPCPAPEQEFWYVDIMNPGKPMLVARGLISDPYWSADGKSVLFLRQVPFNEVLISELHQVRIGEGVESALSRTSQFAVFSPNTNDSVFVGASASKAQPNVILLLNSPHRELTLCEHRSTRAPEVKPVFSPDSRRVYFQSNREGKSAIYSVNVELLVEPVEAAS